MCGGRRYICEKLFKVGLRFEAVLVENGDLSDGDDLAALLKESVDADVAGKGEQSA
mgnify:FL=1